MADLPGVRVLGAIKPGYETVLTAEALAFVVALQRKFNARRIALLERKIGQQALEIDFLKKALQRVENLRRDRIVSGAGGSTK